MAVLHVEPTKAMTPLAKAEGSRLQENLGLVPILRAGLVMVEGV